MEETPNFDSLFLLGEADESLSAKQDAARMTGLHPRGSRGGSRGSPARRPTKMSLCPSNPSLLASSHAATRSHSMRDQTNNSREKYQAKNQSRRMSLKTSTNAWDTTPKISVNSSRSNSLVPGEVEVTRQFVATNKKVINRGDSFKHKQRPVVNISSCERQSHKFEDIVGKESVEKSPKKVYRVAFLGSEEVGKTSIIDQFMSSEHADVYEDLEPDNNTMCNEEDGRILTVDVNNILSHISMIEANSDISLADTIEDQNPDCFVLVYAVDDLLSFESCKACIHWLCENNWLGNKPGILVGNKSDLARARIVDTEEGCDLAVQYGLKFTETSPGMGHHIDELLVGIVMQLRLNENKGPCSQPSSLKQAFMGFLNIFTGKMEEKRRSCRNLNM